MPGNGALLLFLWVGSGALRRVRGRSSQVKGACSVAARGRCAPPWTCEPLRPLRAVACGQARGLPDLMRSAPEPRLLEWPPVTIVVSGDDGRTPPCLHFWSSTTRAEDGDAACAGRGYGGGCSGSSTR